MPKRIVVVRSKKKVEGDGVEVKVGGGAVEAGRTGASGASLGGGGGGGGALEYVDLDEGAGEGVGYVAVGRPVAVGRENREGLVFTPSTELLLTDDSFLTHTSTPLWL